METEQITLRELMVRYEAALTDSGAAFSSRYRALQRVNIIVHRHEREGLDTLDARIINAYLCEVDERLLNGKCNKKQIQETHLQVERFLNFVKTGNVKLPNLLKGCHQVISQPYQKIVDAFLAQDMHPNTRNDARWIAHKYFAWLEERGHSDLSRVGAKEVKDFMLDCSHKMSMNTMRSVRLYLKKLYEYLFDADLSDSTHSALLTFKIRHDEPLRAAHSAEELSKLLGGIDRSTRKGKRAYAVMLLGIVLGLRACDVTALKLADIDWQRGEIKILQSKTANSAVLPLTADVAEALQDYIFNARPKSKHKEVFLRLTANAPIASPVTIGEIYRDCCIDAGIPVSKRYHSLRRSLITSMITAGVDLETAAQVGGDLDYNSVKRYVALDIVHLKECALSFAGIEPGCMASSKRGFCVCDQPSGGVCV